MNKAIDDKKGKVRDTVTSAGQVELDESQLDQVQGGAAKQPVQLKFVGVDGESTHKDHTG